MRMLYDVCGLSSMNACACKRVFKMTDTALLLAADPVLEPSRQQHVSFGRIYLTVSRLTVGARCTPPAVVSCVRPQPPGVTHTITLQLLWAAQPADGRSILLLACKV